MGGPPATQANYRISSTESKMLPQPPYKTPSFDLRVKRVNSKGLYHGWLVQFVYNARCASLFVMEQFRVEEYAGSQASNVTYNKHELWQTVRLTKTNYCNWRPVSIFLQVCLSLLSFVFAVLSILSFNSLHEWFIFSCFIQFGSSANVWILINFVIWMKCVKSQRKFSLRSRN